jgi:hypothetical protein
MAFTATDSGLIPKQRGNKNNEADIYNYFCTVIMEQ